MAPNLFCNRTMSPNLQSIGTIFIVKKNKKSSSSKINIMECVYDYLKRQKDGNPTSTKN